MLVAIVYDIVLNTSLIMDFKYLEMSYGAKSKTILLGQFIF